MTAPEVPAHPSSTTAASTSPTAAPNTSAASSSTSAPPDTPAPRADVNHSTRAAPDLTGHAAVRRVLQTLALHDVVPEVVTLPDAARTAAAAAAGLGVTPAEIANSLIFRAVAPDHTVSPMLILTSGAHRVDLVKVAELVDGVDHLDRANAEFVLDTTGFTIGGVAPVGHRTPVRTLVDVSLSRYRYVWAAAGHSHTVFRTTYEELLRICGPGAMPIEVC